METNKQTCGFSIMNFVIQFSKRFPSGLAPAIDNPKILLPTRILLMKLYHSFGIKVDYPSKVTHNYSKGHIIGGLETKLSSSKI